MISFFWEVTEKTIGMASGDAVDEGVGADQDNSRDEEVAHCDEESVASCVISHTASSVHERRMSSPSHLGQHARNDGVKPYSTYGANHGRSVHENLVLKWVTDGEIPLETHSTQI